MLSLGQLKRPAPGVPKTQLGAPPCSRRSAFFRKALASLMPRSLPEMEQRGTGDDTPSRKWDEGIPLHRAKVHQRQLPPSGQLQAKR